MTPVDPAKVRPGMPQPEWFKWGPVGSFGRPATSVAEAIRQALKIKKTLG